MAIPLSQTMTGMALKPSPGSAPEPNATATETPVGAPGNLTPSQQMVEQWMAELEARLNAIPNVNIVEKMQPLIDAAKAQKVPARMPPLAAGIAAFGAPGQADNLAGFNKEVEGVQRQKDAELLRLQQAILGAQIEADMQAGKFKQALEQSKVLQIMKPQLDAAERAQALKDFETKEAIKQKGRMDLARERGNQMRNTLIERGKQLSKGLSIDERLLLAQVNHIAKQQEIALQRAATYDPLSQSWTVNPTDWEDISTQGNDMLEQWITARRPRAGGTAPPVAAPVQKSAADRIREAAAKKGE